MRVPGSNQQGSSPLGKSLWENLEWRKAVRACLWGVWGWARGLGRTLLGETEVLVPRGGTWDRPPPQL